MDKKGYIPTITIRVSIIHGIRRLHLIVSIRHDRVIQDRKQRWLPGSGFRCQKHDNSLYIDVQQSSFEWLKCKRATFVIKKYCDFNGYLLFWKRLIVKSFYLLDFSNLFLESIVCCIICN
jgi:hypothetical protein